MGEPDYSDIMDQEFNWSRAVFGNVDHIKPYDIPEPWGKYVFTTTYMDANLHHDLTTGKAAPVILHLLNGTPMDWYSKKQVTGKSATYGSKFVAARTAVDQMLT